MSYHEEKCEECCFPDDCHCEQSSYDSAYIGPRGPRGFQGDKGATGATGASIGFTGPMGSPGLKGATGPTGIKGDTGATGQTGASGITGATGSTGADGMSGATGAMGPTGAKGNTGMRGLTGDNGKTGATGPKGDIGATGADGKAGVSGATGATGMTGITGATGAAGAKGATGANGLTGPTGNDGIADTITIRNILTADPGSSVTINDVGGSPNHILDFIIPRGNTGAKGDRGERGACKCQDHACVLQMRHVLKQIILLYPHNSITFTMQSGEVAVGQIDSLIQEGAFVQLSDPQGKKEEILSADHIAAFQITNADYHNKITYLHDEKDDPTCDQENAVQLDLQIDTENVAIKAAGKTAGIGKVTKNEAGMIVLTGLHGKDPVFISRCKIEIIKK